jgi:hypothetical protein
LLFPAQSKFTATISRKLKFFPHSDVGAIKNR